MGKKVTRATSRILGSRPNPNHSTTSGAIATSGRVWLMTKTGNSARRTGAKKSIAAESRKAPASEQENPSSVARMVGSALSASARRFSQACPATRKGDGSVVWLMPDRSL